MTLPVVMLSACRGDDNYSYLLSRTNSNRIFESPYQEFVLPSIISDDPDFRYEWGVGLSTIENHSVANLHTRVLRNEEGEAVGEEVVYRINLIPAHYTQRRASTTLVATVFGSDGPVQLSYTVNVTSLLTDELTHISSSKHGHINYTSRGIARNRVFGLRDIVMPSSGDATPGHFDNSGNWIDGTWRDVEFQNSSSSFELTWSYRGVPNIEVWLEEMDAHGNFVRQVYSQNNIARVVHDPLNPRFVTVNFLRDGIVRVVAESAGAVRPGFRPRYEFVYEIVDAVNVHNFEEIKLLERLARYTYISDGVYLGGGQFQTRRDGTTQLRGAEAIGRTLGHYLVPNSNPNGLLSSHFNTTLTPTPTHYLDATPGGVQSWEGYRDDGAFFDEFRHWSPAFRFHNIVIRSTSRDRAEATEMNGRMETWAEGTWFFGDVHGNGFHLDATPYTRSEEGVYRNTHSMRGLVEPYDCLQGHDSLGFEGRRFFPGYGWGDIFIFYLLANNSVLDNITLTGENIPQGPTAIRLNQYNKIGVLGTSFLLGQTRDFSLGRAHNDGIFHDGLYIEGITIQNSIIEKGLTLVGAGFAPNVNNPIRVDTNVLRFGGFTAILGQSYGAGIGMADPENGYAVRNAPRANSLSVRRNSDGIPYPENYQPIHPNPNGGNFGNFIVTRNNIFHDISVSPLLTMPSQSGSHISIEGNENHFFTWLRSNDIQFPEMTDPSHEGRARIAGQSINGMIPPLLNRVFTNNLGQGIPNIDDRGHTHGGNWRSWANTYRAQYHQQHGVFLVNIPVIVVTDEGQQKNNYFTFENSILAPATERAIGLVSDHTRSIGAMPPRGLNQRFDIIMLQSPLIADPGIGLIRVSEMNTASINARIAEMVPAGTRIPTIVSRSIINLDNGLNSTGEWTLHSATDVSLAGHRIELNGTAVSSLEDFCELTNSITVRIEDLIAAGVDGFGLFTFDLMNIASRSREPVSRFSIIFQGTMGGVIPNVVPGTIGFSEDNRYIEMPFNLPESDIIININLMGDEMFPQNRPIEFIFDDGVLRFAGMQLRDGENRLEVQTNFMTLSIRQQVQRPSIGVEAMAIVLTDNTPPFIMHLIGPIDMSGISISIDNTTLTSTQFTIDNSTIIVWNSVVREILGERYAAGTNAEVLITNTRGLSLATNLMIIEERSEFFFATNAITTPFNFAIGMYQSFVNIAPGHRHFNEVHVELLNHVGDNIFGVSFADTACEIEAREQIVRVTDVEGFRVESFLHGSTRFVIPAAAIFEAGVVAGRSYRIWIFSSLHSARTSVVAHQQLWIFNANHDDWVDRAPNFVEDNLVVDLSNLSEGGARLDFSEAAYLFDKSLDDINSIADILPLLELGGIELPERLATLLDYIARIEQGDLSVEEAIELLEILREDIIDFAEVALGHIRRFVDIINIDVLDLFERVDLDIRGWFEETIQHLPAEFTPSLLLTLLDFIYNSGFLPEYAEEFVGIVITIFEIEEIEFDTVIDKLNSIREHFDLIEEFDNLAVVLISFIENGTLPNDTEFLFDLVDLLKEHLDLPNEINALIEAVALFVFDNVIPNDLRLLIDLIDLLREHVDVPQDIDFSLNIMLYLIGEGERPEDLTPLADMLRRALDEFNLPPEVVVSIHLMIIVIETDNLPDDPTLFVEPLLLILERLITLPTISFLDSDDFSQSTFSGEGSIFAIRNERGQILYQATRDDIFFGRSLVSFYLPEDGSGNRVDARFPVAVIPFLNDLDIPLPDDILRILSAFLPILDTREIPIPMEVPSEAYYLIGFTISPTLLNRLGVGSFTIEVRNNFNIAFATLTIVDSENNGH